MTTIQDIQAAMLAEFGRAVKERITENKAASWAQEDCAIVMLEMAKAYHDAIATADSEPEADKLIDAANTAFLVYANKLSNSSAFRQWLESNGKLPNAPKKESKKGSPSASLLAAI